MDPIPESDDIQCFNRWAGTYEKSVAQFFIDRLHRDVLDMVGKQAVDNSPGAIADIGCGTGRLLRSAGKRWPAARLIGVDHSPGMLDVARRLTPAGVFYAGSAEALPLPDNSVEAAFSTLSIHHWTEPSKGVQEIVRILRPGGTFCLADIRGPGVLSIVFNHFKFNRSETWNALFSQAGLTVLALERPLAGFGLIMLGKKGTSPLMQ
ncbi:MAG: class I SAM-dependent methyltransferase [Anaerolineales bacterium]|jgi:ubiquinone/menaquinone biosynthesis C-methylase UbiE